MFFVSSFFNCYPFLERSLALLRLVGYIIRFRIVTFTVTVVDWNLFSPLEKSLAFKVLSTMVLGILAFIS